MNSATLTLTESQADLLLEAIAELKRLKYEAMAVINAELEKRGPSATLFQPGDFSIPEIEAMESILEDAAEEAHEADLNEQGDAYART